MPLFSVVVPTYDHCDTITWAIKSVQWQTIDDFELIIVGDGVPDRTREIVREVQSRDSRVVFHDNPKGENKGELHRHAAIGGAKGTYIAYQADDDLWFPNHLETLLPALREADFCNTAHTCVLADGKIKVFPGDVAREQDRLILSKFKHNFFGPTCAAHSRSAYDRLPHGWQPAPEGIWTDLHMWRQWFAQREMRFQTIPQVTTIHLDSPLRKDMTLEQRVKEIEDWYHRISNPAEQSAIELEGFRDMLLTQGSYEFYARLCNNELGELRRELRDLRQQAAR